MGDVLIGVLMTLCGSVGINLGTNILKYSYKRNDKRFKATRRRKPNLSSRSFLVGITVFVIGNIVNFASFSFTAQSLLAGLGSVQFVSNVIFGYFLLEEPITKRTLFATGLIICGNSLLVIFSSKTSVLYETGDLLKLWIRTPYLIYLGCASFLLIVLQSLYYKITVLKGPPYSSKQELFIPLAYSAVSALLGTQTVLFAKMTSILLRSTFTGDNQLFNPITYAILILWIITMMFWLYRMNNALRKFSGGLIVPLLQGMWIVVSVVSGGIFFKEFSDFNVAQAAGYFCGLLLILLGVFFMAPKKSSKKRKSRRNIELVQVSENSGVALGESRDSERSVTSYADEEQKFEPKLLGRRSSSEHEEEESAWDPHTLLEHGELSLLQVPVIDAFADDFLSEEDENDLNSEAHNDSVVVPDAEVMHIGESKSLPEPTDEICPETGLEDHSQGEHMLEIPLSSPLKSPSPEQAIA